MNMTSTDIGTRQPSHPEIAARAYELFQQRGCRHGRDVDDWFQAESELLHLATFKMPRPALAVTEPSPTRKTVKLKAAKVTRPKRLMAA